jgi:hypothetical protein
MWLSATWAITYLPTAPDEFAIPSGNLEVAE